MHCALCIMLFFVFLHTETNSKRNDMKRIVFLLAIILSAVLGSSAQEKSQITASLTAYPDFRPATVYMANGKKVNVALANIFLKNSSLLYVNSKGTPMEADTKTLLRVDFSDRSYFRVDTLMAYPVDTVGTNGLFCAWVIDLVAYRQTVRNNTNITNLDLSSTNMINYSTLDVSDIEALPLIPIYYFKLDGKFILAHERHLLRILDKEKRRQVKGLMAQPDFSWTDEASLLKVMKVII